MDTHAMDACNRVRTNTGLLFCARQIPSCVLRPGLPEPHVELRGRYVVLDPARLE